VGAINYQCGAFTGATNAVPINFPGNFVQLANLQTVMASFTTGSVGVGPNIVFLEVEQLELNISKQLQQIFKQQNHSFFKMSLPIQL